MSPITPDHITRKQNRNYLATAQSRMVLSLLKVLNTVMWKSLHARLLCLALPHGRPVVTHHLWTRHVATSQHCSLLCLTKDIALESVLWWVKQEGCPAGVFLGAWRKGMAAQAPERGCCRSSQIRRWDHQPRSCKRSSHMAPLRDLAARQYPKMGHRVLLSPDH